MDRVKEVTGLTLESWEIESPAEREKFFSSDAVIDAYLKGKKDGLEKEQKLVFQKFDENIKLSKNSTNQLYAHLIKGGFKPLGAYIKFESWDKFSSLIAVSEEDYVTDDFLNIYEYAAGHEGSVCTETYTLNFTFMPVSDQGFEKSLWCDGYIFRLKPSTDAPGSRQA